MRDFFRPGRDPALAGEAMIATSHPLSTSAGLAVLAEGGNAVDAVIAAVAVQCVVDPLMTGIGGDCFALYAPAGGDVIALNGSGRAPAAATVERLKAEGLSTISRFSPHAVTVPGAVAAWEKLHRDHGRLPFDRLLRPAIGYAENGYPVTARVAHDWAEEAGNVAQDANAGALFLRDGAAYETGDRHAQPALAETLKLIAKHGAKAYYTGDIAASSVAYLKSIGGLHEMDDFESAVDGADYVAPIATHYIGVDVYECPPNGQGLAALMIMNILSGFDLTENTPLATRIHLHAEAAKLAYYHRDALISDPSTLPYPVEMLLSEETAATLRGRIRMDSVLKPALWNEPEHKDTVYICAVDRDGNALSFINSIFNGFGSTRLDPATGILFHSRGSSFRLIEGHPNAISPSKRPMHTIIPGMVRKNDRTIMPFGVMGGQYQAAGHAAFISGMFDRGLNVQQAIDAPRSFAFDGVLELENTIDADTAAELTRIGHKVTTASAPLGGAQAIFIDHERGLLHGGSDQRKDGSALGF